jgi:hypothetical protein
MLHNALLFSVIKTINGINYDDHYHFGIKRKFTNNSNNIHNSNIIYFHKTVQRVALQDKKPENCYFLPNQDIRYIELIDCLQEEHAKMGDDHKFPVSKGDFKFIKAIIQKPFARYLSTPLPITTSSSSSKTNGGKKKSSKRIKLSNKTVRKTRKDHQERSLGLRPRSP